MKLRAALWLHLYLGLAVLVATVTGMLLVFGDELDRLVNRELFEVEGGGAMRPLDELVATVNLARPGSAIALLTLSSDAQPPLVLSSDDAIETLVDPDTGDIFGQRAYDRSFIGVRTDRHMNYLMGEAWAVATGSAALIAALTAATGLYLWRPRVRRRRALSFPLRGPPRALIYNAHPVVGAYAAAVLLIVTATGAALAFPDQWHALNERVTATPLAQSRAVVKAGTGAFSLEAAIAAARRAVPDADPIRIGLPRQATDPLRVQMRRPGEPHPNGRTNVLLHLATMAVLAVNEPRTIGLTVDSRVLHLHLGYWGGAWGAAGDLVTRFIWLVAMSGAVAVIITGPAIWWIKRRSRRGRRDTGPAAGQPALMR